MGGCFRQMRLCGCGGILSQCVCVYWPDDHCCYYGSVTGWNGAAHTVVYEDGDVVTEKLGGANAPYWMVTTI